MRALLITSAFLCAFVAALNVVVPETFAQREVTLMDPAQAQAELERASRESEAAEARASRLAREAEAATQEADRTAREAASIAAEIQATEAKITAARAQLSITQAERAALSERLAERQKPLVRLTGALQTTARRPLALSALQPGSLKDLVYVRAILDTAVPEIQRRTAALRGELEERERLETEGANALATLRSNEVTLLAKRAELVQLETRQRLASQEARGNSARESERALSLAEEARDLDGLIDQLDKAAALRRDLAELPGPVMRPADISSGPGTAESTVAPPQRQNAPARFQLPVQGRTVAGFGELRDSGLRSTSLVLAPARGAQVVAPASGRVAFAGPYRGFGRIVIIEHQGGWTSLVTGLDRIAAEVGDEVIGGGPLGIAGNDEPVVSIELRRNGDPVNPLNYLG